MAIGFELDNNGDVVIKEGKIQTVCDTELIAQKVRQVLKTNRGEWWLNENEGIDYQSILCKNPNLDQIEDNINLGLRQVDETLKLIAFDCQTEGRKLVISLTAVNDNGETINVTL